MNSRIEEVAVVLRKWNNVFCAGMTCKTNLKRDMILIGIYVVVLIFFVFSIRLNLFPEKQWEEVAGEMSVKISEEEIYQEVKAVRETVNTSEWKTQQSRWYGVEIKYPKDWLAPKVQAVPQGASWEYRYQFRKKSVEENSPYIGFDLAVYNLTKIKELSDTAEFPTVKDAGLKKEGKCDNIAGHLIETGDYPAEEIYLPPTDDCYNPALFFSFTKDQYIYNVVPVAKDGRVLAGDPRVEVIDNFPEFFGAVSTLKIIDIVRPRPVAPTAVKPRITAPRPAAETNKDSQGRMVCKKKNDNPSKSNKGKGKHLDMECCLDPDEYPNPWCYYDPGKYGKYLKQAFY